MENAQVVYSISLVEPITGRRIMDAVLELETGTYKETVAYVIDDKIYYAVGRKSGYPYEHMAIGVGTGFRLIQINPEESYTSFAVVNYSWPGMVYAVGYDDDSLINAMRKYRDDLQALLTSAR